MDKNKSKKFVQQIYYLDSIPGVGFLSAVTFMCEIGDFSAFSKPKQLFAYFGVDPSVNESGNFKGTDNKMSKRGSKIARRVLYAIALASVRVKRNGIAINPVLYDYYQKKKESKPKKVALGAIMHKISDIVFAVLRDNKPFVLKTPDEHKLQYQNIHKAA
nr:transposase [Thermoanaerobacterium thermosaccharolyticum]